MNRKKLTSTISLLFGIAVFTFIFWYIGPDSLLQAWERSKPIYLIPFAILAFLSMLFLSIKLKYILGVFKQKIPLRDVLRYTFAGFAISYLTPSARIGGEPLKIYMLKKEHGVPFKIGGSSVVVDKYLELMGSIIIAVVGLVLLFFIPGVGFNIKGILFLIILFFLSFFIFIYYTALRGKGPFTTLLRLFKLDRFKKISKFLIGLDKNIRKFFVNHQKELFIGLSIYLFTIFLGIIEFKFLLLALGVNASVIAIILAHVVLGITNFIPVPAGLGFQEAGHSGLFALLKQGGSLGLLFSLMIRVRNLIITGIGFIIITNFGGEEIRKYYKMKEVKK